VQLSLCLDPRRPWSHAVRLAQLVDGLGWSTVYVPDHFLPVDGGVDPAVALQEAWTSLSALSAATTRVRLATLVLGAAYRHPAVVANMAATLDRISSGRLVLGLGAGWQPNEHEQYGIPLLPPAQRCDRFAESCAVIDGLLHHSPFTFDGDYYWIDGAHCGRSAQQPRVPLLIGGGGEHRILRIAARYADAWHWWATPSEFAAKSAVLDARCAEIDRDPSSIRRVTGQVLHVIGPDESVDDLPAALDPSDDVVGGIDEVRAELRAYRDVGVDEFIVRDHGALDVDAMSATVTALSS
jgi:alkanesulfonate monooxygenase SsuD/methylene tetrahydromethanopterin reductase-like flavin-dependent oxidoreductase (luciferase family)